MLIRITAKHFTAGIELDGPAAPILKYMKGWSLSKIQSYCEGKGWKVEIVAEADK